MEYNKVLIDNSKIAYFRRGDRRKPKILFIHGLLSSSSYFNSTINFIKDDFDILSVDLPGYGLSEKMKGKKHNVKNFAIYIRKLCDELRFKGFSLVGGSLGGMVSIQFTLMFQQYVKKLVVQGTPWLKDSIRHPFIDYLYFYIVRHKKVFNMFKKFRDNVTRENFENMLKIFSRNYYYNYNKSDGVIYYFFKSMNLGLQKEVWERMEHLDFTKEIKKLKKPTLILLGKKDTHVKLGDAKKLAGVLEDAKLKVFKNGSHTLFLDYPEKLAKILKDFLYD